MGRADSSTNPGSLNPFDPSAYDVHMTTEERAFRAEHMPGGEISYCCCYCGRRLMPNQGEDDDDENEDMEPLDDVEGREHGDSWIYSPLPSQPRPEKGDLTERQMRRRRKFRHRRRRRRHGGRRRHRHHKRRDNKKGHHAVNETRQHEHDEGKPYATTVNPGVAQFYLYRTVMSRCNNEYCIDQNAVCLKSHLWTGWAGDLTTPDKFAPEEIVKQRCQNVYQREMEVLADVEKMASGDSH